VTHLVVGVGDIHAGGSTAVCPPEGIELDDGGWQTPNKVQRWLSDRWLECWDTRFPALLDRYQPDGLSLVLNGDLTEGIHHQTPQASPLAGQHFRAAHKLLETGPLKYKPDYVHLVRGTEAHVGRSGELEEGLARTLKAEGVNVVEDPDTGQASSYWRRIEIEGVRLDVRHHGRMGQRAHTRGPYERWYAQDIELEHYLDGEDPPHLAIRSHLHKYADSGRSHRWTTRVVSLPCWQAMTSFAHRITAESLSDVGAVVFPIRDGALLEPEPILFPMDRPTLVRTA
jgi:hypothetical protein